MCTLGSLFYFYPKKTKRKGPIYSLSNDPRLQKKDAQQQSVSAIDVLANINKL